MRIVPEVFEDADRLGSAVASLVLDRIRRAGPRPFLLGCPGGRSLRTTYLQLGRQAAADGVDLSRLVVVMMDEYVLPAADGFTPVPDTAAHSCRRFGREEIMAPINAAYAERGAAEPVGPDQLWVPDPRDPDAYEDRLTRAGGIDVFLLASGATDGHVAFNAPGSALDSRTRVVELPDSTRRDNLATFPSFGGELDAVPRHGVTVGIATIRDRSHEVIMVVHGPEKRTAAARLARAQRYDPDWPATVASECRHAHLVLDRAAAPTTATINAPSHTTEGI